MTFLGASGSLLSQAGVLNHGFCWGDSEPRRGPWCCQCVVVHGVDKCDVRVYVCVVVIRLFCCYLTASVCEYWMRKSALLCFGRRAKNTGLSKVLYIVVILTQLYSMYSSPEAILFYCVVQPLELH